MSLEKELREALSDTLAALKAVVRVADRKTVEFDAARAAIARAERARYTSQTCPECGQVAKKELSQRIHSCDCGCVLDRDHAAARVILSKAVASLGPPNASISRAAGNLSTETLTKEDSQ